MVTGHIGPCSHGLLFGGSDRALCAESFCERTLPEANDVRHEVNMLLGTKEVNMLVVLRINR